MSPRRLVLDVEMLHLVAEMAAAKAVKEEIQRQFKQQHPHLKFVARNTWLEFGAFESLDLQLPPDWEVEYVGGDVGNRG